MKRCHAWTTLHLSVIPDLSIVWGLLSTWPVLLCPAMFRDFKHSSSPTAGRAGQIVQSGVWFWNIQMRWNLNEGRLSSVRRCTAKTRSLLSFARVFFFSWIEYQLISWVICCSGNWVKGWEQTAHIHASHQGTVDNKRVPFNSWFSLFCNYRISCSTVNVHKQCKDWKNVCTSDINQLLLAGLQNSKVRIAINWIKNMGLRLKSVSCVQF